MKNNGNHRGRDYEAEIALCQKARAVPPAARPGLLARLRGPLAGGRRRDRPPRTFWLLDPDSGEWRLL